MKPLDFRLYCVPEQAPTDTVVHAEPGWSLSINDVCWTVTAQNILGDQSSSIVTLGYPDDCIPAPEPAGGLGACLLLLSFWARRRHADQS